VTQGGEVDDDRAVARTPETYSFADFDLASLVAARGGRKISVCLPARNEERTVAGIVSRINRELTAGGGGAPLVDEIVVVDDGSTDLTPIVALEAGARVVGGASPLGGKGEAMRFGLAEAVGDIVVFLDADVENFSTHFVTGLLGPLLEVPPQNQPHEEQGGEGRRPGRGEGVALVKAFYERPLEGRPSGGGRVTELTARPVIDLLFPHLREVRQPLAGESAAPREVLEKTGIAGGYGAELGLLIDVASVYGVDSIAQVDLGVRVHRNRSLDDLRHQATDVLRAALERADLGELPSR
jgi:glucosyl-3-phosphoglycerate synthase